MKKLLTLIFLLLSTAANADQLTMVNDSTLHNLLYGYHVPTGITAINTTAFGYQALAGAGASTGIDETAFGTNAIAGNVSGTEDTGMGANVMTNCTSCTNNTAMGAQSLGAVTAANFNTAIGVSAMQDGIGSPFSNTAVGVSALNFATTGAQYNEAVGTQTMYYLTTGSYNTGFGTQSLYNLTAGSKNVGVGYQAGIGGTGQVTTGTDNVFIGYQSGTSSNVSHSIAIGSGAVVTASHQIALGGASDSTVIAGNLTVSGTCTGCGTGGSFTSGAWTPTDASGASLTLTVVKAEYQTVGKQTCVQAIIVYPTTANTSGAVIGGLPGGGVVANGDSNTTVSNAVGLASIIQFQGGTTHGIIYGLQPFVAIKNSQLSAQGMNFSGCYFNN